MSSFMNDKYDCVGGVRSFIWKYVQKATRLRIPYAYCRGFDHILSAFNMQFDLLKPTIDSAENWEWTAFNHMCSKRKSQLFYCPI